MSDYDPDLVDTIRELGQKHGPQAVLEATVAILGPDDTAEVYERGDGDWGFRVKAANHEIIAGGEGYEDASGAERAARRLTFRAPNRV